MVSLTEGLLSKSVSSADCANNMIPLITSTKVKINFLISLGLMVQGMVKFHLNSQAMKPYIYFLFYKTENKDNKYY
jgi:hypothetical protein